MVITEVARYLREKALAMNTANGSLIRGRARLV